MTDKALVVSADVEYAASHGDDNRDDELELITFEILADSLIAAGGWYR
jgi:hypothetical protein